jgi:hypothetical protein
MARDTAPRARRDRGACDRSGRGRRDVSGDQGSMTGGRAADVVAPRSVGKGTSTLRATLRVAPAAPASRSAFGGLRLLIPRPVRQLSVGASRAVSSRPDQDPSALRALRCGSSLGPVVPPPPLPAPEQSSVPDGPGEWVAGHLFHSSSRTGFRSSSGRVHMTSSSTTSSRRTGKGRGGGSSVRHSGRRPTPRGGARIAAGTAPGSVDSLVNWRRGSPLR